jgi:NTP pyrophosphatase (non-canonical NTP hydrolase)
LNSAEQITEKEIKYAGFCLQEYCHGAAKKGGWWDKEQVGPWVPAKLMLVVSEIAEAMEADRKDLMDSHLPDRKGVEVELADAVIRIFDLAGKLKLDMGGAIYDKMIYNANRQDHKPEVRAAAGGKKY